MLINCGIGFLVDHREECKTCTHFRGEKCHFWDNAVEDTEYAVACSANNCMKNRYGKCRFRGFRNPENPEACNEFMEMCEPAKKFFEHLHEESERLRKERPLECEGYEAMKNIVKEVFGDDNSQFSYYDY